MSAARRQAAFILLGVAALVLGIIVLVLDASLSTELLASGLVVGGLAIVVVSLPVTGNGKHEGGG